MRTLTWIAVLASAVACSAGDEPSAPRFAQLGTDVVRDARSGLVWAARDGGRELSWHDADRYCRELALDSGDGAGWLLPSSAQ